MCCATATLSTASTMAPCRASIDANGRSSQAHAATHGESSKIEPRAAANTSRSSAFSSSSVIYDQSFHSHFRHARRIGQGEQGGQNPVIVAAIQDGGERRVRTRAQIIDVRGLARLKIADLTFEPQRFGAGPSCEI